MQSNQLVGLFNGTYLQHTPANEHVCRLAALFSLLPDVVSMGTNNRLQAVVTPSTHRGFMHVINLMTRIYNTDTTRYLGCELNINNDQPGMFYRFSLPWEALPETLKAVINVVEHYLTEAGIDFAAHIPVRQYWVVRPTDTELKVVYITCNEQLAYEARKGADTNMYTAEGEQCTKGISFCKLVSSHLDCFTACDQTLMSNDDVDLAIETFERDGYLVYVSDF